MAIKKNELYSSLWVSCDKLRGGMDASQYKDYILTLLFVKYANVFEWVKDYHSLSYQKRQFILFHYPIAEWERSHHGSIHLHGHQHNKAAHNAANAEQELLRYDVGVDANGMAPVSIEEVLNFFKIAA